jgi:DNA-binding Lrp family transcriptional regulator
MAKEKLLKDEEILEALNTSLENACIPATAVADVLGVNSRYVKDRLLELKKKGLVDGTYKGNSWWFRPTR